jgi:hypothetical protein
VYEWNGSRWNELDPEKSWNKYLDSVSDMNNKASRAVFSDVFVKNLFAETVNGDLIRARMRLQVGDDANYIEINGNGLNAYIKSSNYSAANKTGFLLDYLGNVYFNNGTFNGLLQADQIRITGSVTAGNNYILRKNNTFVEVRNNGVWQYMKSITTFASGSCNIRLTFETGGMILYGRWRIYRNGTLVGTYTSDTANINNFTLASGQTTIDIEGMFEPPGGRPIASYGFGIAKFELWVQNDPGMLSMLGS